MKTVTILGATGSVGQTTARLLQENQNQFIVEALIAGDNVELLAATAKKLNAKHAVIANETSLAALKNALIGTSIQVSAGKQAVLEVAQHSVDITIAAIVGIAGLEPTLAAARHSSIIAIANKESIICGWPLLEKACAASGAVLVPIDSEHNAIFQVWQAQQHNAIRKITLTASGGPFRQYTATQLATVTPEQATQHPIWSMGQKISIDSATLMNKGLEVIEACYLFSLPEKSVEVLVHPQSIIHGMVEYHDGSTLAQLSLPDMSAPIAYALSYPHQRLKTDHPSLNLGDLPPLAFSYPDVEKFPCLALARQAWQHGHSACITLNAANEIAVAYFLQNKIRFIDIPHCLEYALSRCENEKTATLHSVNEIDKNARRLATEYFQKKRTVAFS